MPATSAATKKTLLWSEEFNSKAGTAVSSKYWNYDLGDGTEAGIPGWGNSEREYYIKDIKKLNEDIIELNTSQTQLEKFARKKYLMKKDNEDVYVIVR